MTPTKIGQTYGELARAASHGFQVQSMFQSVSSRTGLADLTHTFRIWIKADPAEHSRSEYRVDYWSGLRWELLWQLIPDEIPAPKWIAAVPSDGSAPEVPARITDFCEMITDRLLNQAVTILRLPMISEAE